MESLFWSIVRTIGRGRLTRVDDSGPVQLAQMQLSAKETHDNMPCLALYGFQSCPPEGSDALAVFLGGDRTNGVIVANGNQRYRIRNLAPGEACISDNRGQSVYLSASGIVVRGGGLPVTITDTPSVTVQADARVLLDTPLVHCTGELLVDGNIAGGRNITAVQDVADQGGAKTMAGMRSAYNGHRHPVTGVQGGSDTVTSDTPDQPQQ